jgi:hypothetical protein
VANFELRGFNQYRFSDSNAFMAALEHRWYAFSGLEMAAVRGCRQDRSREGTRRLLRLNYSGGIGLARPRARRGRAAHGRRRSREGTRWIWSMSDVSRRRF